MATIFLRLLTAVLLLIPLSAQDSASDRGDERLAVPVGVPADQPATPDSPAAPDAPAAQQLNLLGQARTDAGESRRNENVQFNLIDNNASTEVNIRLGTTATITREFDAKNNYFAGEYGTPAKRPIHIAPGTNRAFHGELKYAHLNSITTARSFFQVGGVQPARENKYSVRTVLPLWEGGHFTFRGSQQKIRGQVNGNVLVPSPDERVPLATDPAVGDVVGTFLSVYPAQLPNRTDINERMLNTNSPQVIDDNNIGGRLDQDLGKHGAVVIDYSFFSQDLDAFQLIQAQNPDTRTKNQKARISWTGSPDAASTLSLTVGFDRVDSLIQPEESWGNGPAVFVSTALTSFGNSSTIPIDRAQNLFRPAAQYTRIQGDHSWFVGGQTIYRQVNGFEADAHRGAWSFSNGFGNTAIENLRLGTPTAFFFGLGSVHRGFRDWDAQLYAGDKWNVNQQLQLHYGLRYRATSRPSEVDDLNVLPYDCDCNNFGPTFGFAYPLPEKFGVVRSAFGIFYGSTFPVTYMQQRFNAPLNVKLVIQRPNILDPVGDLDPNDLGSARSVLYEISPDLISPYSMQYNFSWDLSPADAWSLSLGYVGSRSPQLFSQWYFNRGLPREGVESTLRNVNARRDNARFSDRRFVNNGSRGYYDAAKVEFRVREWRGVGLRAAYWFSKAMDLGTDYNNTAANDDAFRSRSQFEDDVHNDMKARTRFDQPHALLLSVTYETPQMRGAMKAANDVLGSWRISTVTLVKSGTPFNVATGSDAPGFGNVDGISGDRPNILDPSILGSTIGHPDTATTKLPRSAFSFIEGNAGGGSLGRYVFRKGPIRNVNATLARSWNLPKETELTVRAESINFLNTPQFSTPGPRLTDPNFGVITNTLNEGRTFRFGVDLEF